MTIAECREIFGLLSSYLDQELPEDICRQVESHISGCPPCVEFVESLKKSVALCHEFRSQELPGPLPVTAREDLLAAYQKMLVARKP